MNSKEKLVNTIKKLIKKEREDYLLSETKRIISDALLINPHIKSVEDVSVNKDLDMLNITCMVNTKYGDVYVKI